ncbi:galactosyl transferase GMA12/MNN10 domain protein [Caballeronia hypogeia]|uniref:Galactosyl transferase GMA12/MNN10 domain protein n=1 Tax=Caballeronia hypogeia TaxID=1777140 RepID=A0A158BE43_9BURK|nr:hypothetical protein [Caballeronia hypogeia]SAK68344.1 galactosyl transferase GMA12/MNN10 domain protein [Caballeronia hypogeia]
MTTRCLSIFSTDAPHVLTNHKHYASQMGYQHASVSTTAMPGSAQRLLLKYEVILHHLRNMPDMALLVCMTQDCIVLNMHPVEPIADGRQHALMSVSGRDEGHQTDVQIWRNTPEIRSFIVSCVEQCKLGGTPRNETEMLSSLDYIEPFGERGGVMCTMHCGPRFDPTWSRQTNLWTIALGEVDTYGGIHANFREALAEHINDFQQKGSLLFHFPAESQAPNEEHSVYNPGQPIALVTYYTPNVRAYGAIAELNMRRYCERHGYTLYVYRQTPAEVGPGTSGTWLKPWFLRKHLPDHTWVIWVDADILFHDQRKPLEPLLTGRDIFAAHDIGPWVINAGVLGFRRKPAVSAFVEEIYENVSAAPDKSSTYANGGDQTIIANLLSERLGWKVEHGVDCMSINTPWYFQQADSLMVHFVAIQSPLRAVVMAAQERASLQLG